MSGFWKILWIVFFLADENICLAQWSPKTSIPANAAQHGLVSHPNGNIYLFNGYNGSNVYGFSSTLHIYNISANTWTTGPNLPYTARGVGYCLGTDNNIYCIGGVVQTVTNSFVSFNPSTNAWSSLAPCPNGSYEGALASYNNKVYYSGGSSNETSLRIYDISTNTWTTGASLPIGVKDHKMISTNDDFLYVFGGFSFLTVPTPTIQAINVVQRYSISANTWTTISTMPVQKNQYGACLAADGRIYIICGHNAPVNGAGPFYSDVNIYDPVTNTWATGIPHPTAHGELAAVSSNCGIFAMGGSSGAGLSINYFLPVSSIANISLTPSMSICVNQTATLTVSGVSTCTWSTGSNSSSIVITPTAAAVYSYSIVSIISGCASTNSAVIGLTVDPLPNLIVTSSSPLICNGENAILTVVGANSYTWSDGSTNSYLSLNPTLTTTYSVSGIDLNGCSNLATITQSVDACVGFSNSLSANSGFKIFPNPSSEKLFIETDIFNKSEKIEVYNSLNQRVYFSILDSNSIELNISDYPNGVYLVNIFQNGRVIIQKRIIKI